MSTAAARIAFTLSLVALLFVAPNALINVSGMDHARAATSDSGTLALVGALLLIVLVTYVNYARKVLR